MTEGATRRHSAHSMRRALLAAAALLCAAGALHAAGSENDPAARFRGPPTYDFGVTNVKWEAATPEYSFVTFDLYWSYSWRAKWTEPAATSCIGKDIEVENWDAAWVFVKFLPEKDSKESIESNLWRHATLDTDPARHVMPAGATNAMGLSDDGSRGLGVFIYRDRIGHGVNDWKGIKLRWLHGAASSTSLGAGNVDPAKAAVKVVALPMVYVPAGAFKLGSGNISRIQPFPDGPNLPSLQLGQHELGMFLDGSWRGGPTVPFLVDAEWNGPAAAGSRARRLGAVAGELWGLGGYVHHCTQAFLIPFACSIGLAGTLNDDYPTGHEAFYCMKYQVTQGQYVEFLNCLPQKEAAALIVVPAGEFMAEPAAPYPWERSGNTITDPARIKISSAKKKKAPEPGEELSEGEDDELESLLEPSKKAAVASRPAYGARLPNRTCNFLHWQDGFAYAAWAALRPMTELEFEKMCRGPLNPVPCEHAWGSAEAVASAELQEADLPTERYLKGNYHASEPDRLWSEKATRAGIFATPDSDRFRAGATYWGILDADLATFAVSAATPDGRAFRGSHGDGRAPSSGTPGASLPPDWPPPGGRTGTFISQRSTANIPSDRPPTYPSYGDRRSCRSSWRGVRSAAVGKRAAVAPAPIPPDTAGEPTGTRTNTADWDIAHDNIKVGNVACEVGSAQYSTVTCDIEWENAWRARWTEPAEKNVTGKPLQVESWDAAWVFVKYRQPGDPAFSHAMLSTADGDHKSPPGSALSVGLSDDGSRGLGVFVYRAGPGIGANAFRGIKLRWLHPPSSRPQDGRDSGAASPARLDPARAELVVHAIPMVYVPGGPFQTKGPWGHPLTLISTGDATQPGGHRLEPAPFVSGCWGAETDAGQVKQRRDIGATPQSDSWPNGYRPFYCTKYSITQGQYADFLNSLAPKDREGSAPRRIVEDSARHNFNRFTIHFLAGQDRFVAEAPDRLCNQLSCGDIFAYLAWAGLRPLTDMEYEKACRGPRAVTRAEDAWNAAACARADGLEKASFAAGSPPPSFWGIRELSLTGIPFEWPLTFHNELGLIFKGTHGNGGLEFAGGAFYRFVYKGTRGSGDPEDWLEIGDIGEAYEDRMGWGTQVGVWIDPSDVGLIPRGVNTGPFWDRTGRYGVHAGRTAPTVQSEDSPLQVTRLPNMTGYEVGIFDLAGRFRNERASPVKVEIAGLPDACFVGGAASRAFTAAAKSDTPFKVCVAITSLNAAKLVRRDRTFPLQIRAVGGAVLAEQSVLLSMIKPESEVSAIRAFSGGAIAMRLLNATDRPVSVAIALQPTALCKPAESERRAEIAAGKEVSVTFPVPRQGFPTNGLYCIPFRVTVAGGAAQAGEISVNLLNQSRWWGGRNLKSDKPVMGGKSPPSGGSDEMNMLSVLEAEAPEGMPAGFFKMGKPPEGWKAYVVNASAVPLKDLGGLPAYGSSAIAGTKLFAPAAREVKVRVSPDGITGDILRVWINEKVVFDSRPDEELGGKPFLLRAGMNTMAASWRSAEKPTSAWGVSVVFVDGKTGQPMTDLVLDMEGK